MKSAKHSVKAKVPKARVMYADRGICRNDDHAVGFIQKPGKDIYIIPVAVLPFATAKQAREAVKVHNMTHEERVKVAVQSILQKDPVISRNMAAIYSEIILSALQFPAAGRNEG